MDAGRGAACAAWLLAGLARPTVVHCRADADRDRHVSVLLALERVPHCERLQRSSAQRSVRPSAPQGVVAVAVAASQLGGLVEEGAVGLRVVPRTRWSCATLAAQLCLQRGIAVSSSTMRRWLHALGWGWKRAQLVARDDDPQRGAKLARIRYVLETLGKRAVVLFADELDIHLLPKVGYQWMLKGETVKLVTPGQNQKHYLAGALEPRTGRLVQCTSARKTNALFRALLDRLEWLYPKAQFTTVSVVVDNYGIHTAKAVARWLAVHPRFEVLFLPTYCPKANPIERACGDVHAPCTRNHQRTRIEALVRDVEHHLALNGPWQYQLSHLYYTLEATAALERLTQKQQLPQAA